MNLLLIISQIYLLKLKIINLERAKSTQDYEG